MRKSTKGALAGAAAALLLMGGLGTHATWSDNDSVTGTAIGAGHLALINPHCNGWLISGNAFDPATIKIVPGSVLTQVCTFEVDAVGANLKATLSVTAPTFTGDDGLIQALQTSATYKDQNGTTIATTGTPTQLSDTDVITATMTVTLPTSATNAVQDLNTALGNVTVTATQA